MQDKNKQKRMVEQCEEAETKVKPLMKMAKWWLQEYFLGWLLRNLNYKKI